MASAINCVIGIRMEHVRYFTFLIFSGLIKIRGNLPQLIIVVASSLMLEISGSVLAGAKSTRTVLLEHFQA